MFQKPVFLMPIPMPSLRVCAVVLALSLATPSVYALNLLEVVRQAESKDPKFAAIKSTYLANMEGPAIARAALLPQAVVSASSTSNTLNQDRTTVNNGLLTLGGRSEYDSRDVSARLTQTLFDLPAFRQYESAELLKSRDEARAVEQVQQYRLDVANQYFDVLRAQSALDLARAREKTLDKRLEEATVKFKLGTLPKLDLLEAQAQFDQTRSQRLTAEISLNAARQQLSTRLGGDRSFQLAPLKPTPPLIPPVPVESGAWQQLAQKRNPALVAARHEVQSSEKDQGSLIGGYLPQVNAVATVSQRKISGSDNLAINLNGGRSDSVGVELKWELFGGGRTTARLNQATQRTEALKQTLAASEATVGSTVANLFDTVQNDAGRVKANRTAVNSALQAKNALEAGYKLGTHTLLDLLTAENRLQQAEIDLRNAQFDYLQNSLRLHASAGVLYDSILSRYNQMLGQ